jgi:phospholipid-transporting ATPase
LQDQVGEVIRDIKLAGVKLWVLTGDKIETAINIGFSCQLLDQDMEIFILNEVSSRGIYKQMCDFNSKQKIIGLQRDTALVVGGEQLLKITAPGKEKILKEFIEMATNSNVVMACRVSPKQKAEVVNLVREAKKDDNITTLAIGDGANDVNMINAAHIGIGIRGKEGQQAARAADYSIG